MLPILLDAETEFAALYSGETGRPSVARMLGICVLQDMLGLDDQSAIDSLAFDFRWQHALSLEPEDAYLSRRSLVEFRSRLVSEDPETKALRRLFERIGEAAIEELGLSTKEQRVDSTLVTSNIFTRGRVELFRKTLTHFMDWLSVEHPGRLVLLSLCTREWYEEVKEGGWFGKVEKDMALAAQREDSWWDRYKIRSGIEAAMSELKRGHGLGKLRVRRAPRVLLAVGLKVTACNVKRWLRAALVTTGVEEVLIPDIMPAAPFG